MLLFFKPDSDVKGNEPQMYNGDYPYIHWAEPFSTGVIRYKSLYFLSDSPTVRVRMDVPDNWNFALCNNGPFDPENIEHKNYTNIDDFVTDFVALKPYKYNDYYLYQLNILCRSDVEGEYIEDFYINEIRYRIGAEFWGENEAIKINLANQGTEIPDFVCKAIYGSNVYEGSIDWVLLNRKFRELLTNHIEILDNKGSYKSLLDALKWFEYDNLVELREVWKYETPDGTKYYDHPIDTMVNDEIKNRMFNSSKTTYFALRHLIRRITGHKQNAAEYDDTIYDHDPDDNINVLNKIACKWTEDDMRLKMVLLGNFFETYFMPIHTDLIRSVVEDISDFFLNIDFSSGNTVEEESTGTDTFDFSWGDPDDPNNPVIPNDPLAPYIVEMDEIHAYAGIEQPTIIGRAFENTNEVTLNNETIIPMIACHTYDEPNGAISETQLRAAIYGLIYNGPGAIAVANFSFDEQVISGKCISNQWGEYIETKLQPGSLTAGFKVKFLFPKPGTFEFFFEFIGESGAVYTKSAQITVADNLRVDVAFYKLQSMSSSDYIKVNPFTTPSNITPMLTIQREHDYKVVGDNIEVGTDIKYTRYIPFRIIDNNAPTTAPCVTTVRTLQWAGNNDIAKQRREKFLKELWRKYPQSNYWIETGVDTNDVLKPTTWVRICSRYKHTGLWAPFISKYGPDKMFDSYVFFPELHVLKKIAPGEHINAYYPIVCVPEIIIDGKNGRRLKYSELTGEPAWEFFSYGLNKDITDIMMPQAISTNILASAVNSNIPRGMYRITFRYKFGKDERVVVKTPNWIIENA